MVYAIGGLMAALAGPVLCALTNRITASSGSGYELSAISIAVLGGTILEGGKGGVVGTFVATIIFAILLNLLALSGMGTYTELLLRGVILVLIVAVFQKVGSSREI
jgi:ribose/xylose/arabinose/galactoside ABC-type transport system permease subunit